MRQRAMIAMAITNEPKLLIADEPTTALDVTVQAQILELIERLQSEIGMAVMMITHDLGVVAEMADGIAVMYAGRVVERAADDELFAAPSIPTRGACCARSRGRRAARRGAVPIEGRPPSLINRPSGCAFHPRCPFVREAHKRIDPQLEPVAGRDDHAVACLLSPATRRAVEALRAGEQPEPPAPPCRWGRPPMSGDTTTQDPHRSRTAGEAIFEVRDLVKDFPLRAGLVRRARVHAVDGVSFEVGPGETFGMVGESGCGKSTPARMLLRLRSRRRDRPLRGARDRGPPVAEMQPLRRAMQMVFQDPYASLNPGARSARSSPSRSLIHGVD